MELVDSTVVQFLDTTIISKKSQISARIVVVPKDAISDESILQDPPRIMESLDLQFVQEVGYLSGLPQLLSIALSANLVDNPNQARQRLNETEVPHDPEARRFAETLTFGNVVPFHNSPPWDLQSLTNIVLKATGPGIGAWVGFVVSGGSLLALITVPAGMILCGAAMGVGKALEQGLNNRLFDLIIGRKPPEKKVDVSTGQAVKSMKKIEYDQEKITRSQKNESTKRR